MTKEEHALILCCDMLARVTGSCPFHSIDYDFNCYNKSGDLVCENKLAECWKLYFMKMGSLMEKGEKSTRQTTRKHYSTLRL